MPFKSEGQRRFMWAKHPEIARRWSKEGKAYMDKNKSDGTTIANNSPVGSAGQPFNPIKKEVPEGKAKAIQRRMQNKKKEMGKK